MMEIGKSSLLKAKSRISFQNFRDRAPLFLSQTLFLAVAGLAPLPYGSRDASTVSVWCILLGLALIAAPLRGLKKPHIVFSFGLVFVLCCAGFILHEQLAAQPWLAQPHPLWEMAGEALGHPVHSYMSIVRNEPFFALGPSLCAVLALWLGLVLGTDPHRAWRLLFVVGISGAVYAIYGVLSAILEPNILLFRERESFIGYVTGTFVNRNTAAIYFGSCVIIWQLHLTVCMRRLLPHAFSHRTRFAEAAALISRRDVMLRLSAFVICLVALFMTGSRAGIILSLAVLVVAITLRLGLDQPRRRGLLIVFASAVGMIASLYLIFGGALDARFELQGLNDGGRSEIYHSTLRLIADHPWFGSGLGTFEWAFPAYRGADVSLWGIWDLAHSTPLELAVDLGLPLALLIGAGWIAVLWILLRGVFVRRRDAAIPLAGFSIALLGLLHSAVDFSLQVPGFAIVSLAVIGTGIGQAFPSATRRSSINADGHKRRQEQ